MQKKENSSTLGVDDDLSELCTLVVDEDVHVRSELYQILEQFFRKKGIKSTMVIAKDTDSSINVTEAISPDLIILGEGCGFDVIDYARNRGHKFHWLLTTAILDKESRHEAEKRKVKAYIIKPFNKGVVNGAVELALDLVPA